MMETREQRTTLSNQIAAQIHLVAQPVGYEKRAVNFLAMVTLASILLWL